MAAPPAMEPLPSNARAREPRKPVDVPPTGGGRELTFLLCLLAALLPIAALRHLLSEDTLHYELDAAQLHLPRFEILGRALRAGDFPLWQNLLYAGAPFHANPENPTLYPPVLLLTRFLPPLLALNLTVVLHLSFAAVGMFLLVRRCLRHEGVQRGVDGAAFLAALVFSFNHYVRFEAINLVVYGASHAWIPWIFLALHALLFGPSPRRASAAVALALAMQLFAGGLYVIAYTAVAVAAWLLFLGVLGDAERRRRALLWGGVALGLAGALALAKVLPYVEWVSTTNRTGALDPETARGLALGGPIGTFELAEAVRRLRLFTGEGVPLLLALTALAAPRSRTCRFFVLLLLFALLVALGPLHGFLYRFVPPFDQIRSGAIRAWTLGGFAMSVATGLGVARVLSASVKSVWRPWVVDAIAVGGALALLPVLASSGWIDDRYLSRPESLTEVLERYPHWKEAAAEAGEEYRAFFADNPDPFRHNEQLVSTRLGVETPAGFLGYAWPRELGRFLLGEEGEVLPRPVFLRRLRILSVRYVIQSWNEQDRRGRARSELPSLFPPGVDGTGVLELEGARPRAFQPSGVLLVPAEERTDEVVAFLRDHPLFDPTRMAVVEVEGAETSRAPEDLTERLRELSKQVAENSAAGPALSFDRPSTNEALIRREDASRAAWVVVSEPWTLHEGWSVRSGERELDLHRADGIATAVFLNAGEAEIHARYRPASFVRGTAFAACGLAGVLLLLAWPRKRSAGSHS